MEFFCGQRVAMECFSSYKEVEGCDRGAFELPGGQEMFSLLNCACEFCPTALSALQELTEKPYHIVSCDDRFQSASVCVDQHPDCKEAFTNITGGNNENEDVQQSKDTLKCQCDICGDQHRMWKDVEIFPSTEVADVSQWSIQEQCIATDVLRCYRDNTGYCSRVLDTMTKLWNIQDYEQVIENAVDRCATMWSFYSENDPYVLAKPLGSGSTKKPGVSRFGFAIVALVTFIVFTLQQTD